MSIADVPIGVLKFLLEEFITHIEDIASICSVCKGWREFRNLKWRIIDDEVIAVSPSIFGKYPNIQTLKGPLLIINKYTGPFRKIVDSPREKINAILQTLECPVFQKLPYLDSVGLIGVNLNYYDRHAAPPFSKWLEKIINETFHTARHIEVHDIHVREDVEPGMEGRYEPEGEAPPSKNFSTLSFIVKAFEVRNLIYERDRTDKGDYIIHNDPNRSNPTFYNYCRRKLRPFYCPGNIVGISLDLFNNLHKEDIGKLPHLTTIYWRTEDILSLVDKLKEFLSRLPSMKNFSKFIIEDARGNPTTTLISSRKDIDVCDIEIIHLLFEEGRLDKLTRLDIPINITYAVGCESWGLKLEKYNLKDYSESCIDEGESRNRCEWIERKKKEGVNIQFVL